MLTSRRRRPTTATSDCRSFVGTPKDLRELLGDKMYSWDALHERCRKQSTRPVIKHCEQSPLQKAHNARIDEEIYNQRAMSETAFALLKNDDGETLRSRSWHGQFRELTRKCIVHNLSLTAAANAAVSSFSARSFDLLVKLRCCIVRHAESTERDAEHRAQVPYSFAVLRSTEQEHVLR